MMTTFENWLQGKMLGSMEKEFARDAWDAALEAMRAESEPVGVTDLMPAANRFTIACFEAEKVPAGTPLFLQPLRELSEDELNRMWGKAIAEGQWGAFVRFAKLVREAK